MALYLEGLKADVAMCNRVHGPANIAGDYQTGVGYFGAPVYPVNDRIR